ncbi:MAG: S9 family peptidase [Chloroflexota bacterium]
MNTHPTLGPEDLFKLQFLQDAVFSPDGNHILYTISHVDANVDKEFVTIWLYTVETETTRAMTNGLAQDTSPQFSPDGKTIAFLSDRGDKPQIYLMPVDGGEARQLTILKQGVMGGPVWSPNGQQIAFSAGPDYEGDKPLDLSETVYRVTRHTYRFDAVGYLDQEVQDIYLITVDSGETQQLTHDQTNNTLPIWSPDGQRILYLANMSPDSFPALQNHMAVVDLTGQVETFSKDQVSVQAVNWTPDGQKIIFVGRPISGVPIGTKSDLWVLDTATREMENRTVKLAVGVGGSLSLRVPTTVSSTINLPIAADSEAAFVRVQEGGNLHIYRMALSGEEDWQAIVTGDRGCSILDLHSDTLLCSVTDMNNPPDIFITQIDGSQEKQITYLNQTFLSNITFPKTEHLHFEGQDGVPVEGWYLRPPNGEAPYPTILYIHGGPHSAYGHGLSFDFQMLAGQGYGVLFINHRASTGYGDEFSTAIKGDWGNLDYGDLMAGVDFAIAQGLADEDRLGCCGTSGGGNLSCWIIGQTDRFKAAVPQNPVTSWHSFYGTSDIGVWFAVEQLGCHPHENPAVYAKCSPITYAHNCKTPTLLVQCESDWRCPAEQSEQFYTVLKANGCTVEMLRQPGGSHGGSIRGAINLRREHLLAMLDWFGRFV